MPYSSSRIRARTALTALPFTMLLGCEAPTLPATLKWQALLEPEGAFEDPVAGSVAMVATENATQIGIGLSSGPSSVTLHWHVRDGTCASGGNRLGPATLFTPLEMSADGSAAVEVALNRRLSGSGQYAAEVFDGPDASASLRACADLQRVD